jgi:predicted phage terminase large subunit-like protein
VLLLQPDFQRLFPDPGCRVARDAPAARFMTAARQQAQDAQPSFLAMGLLSGFTGKGVDHLFIDDPYKSAEDARSGTINEKVWRWWSQTARVRLGAETNVVVMFHRYHEDDFAGRLLNEGGWEYVRFPAIADEKGHDPTCRQPGDLLSPMRSREWLEAEKLADPLTFAGQFQGDPLPAEGALFKVDAIKRVPARPAGLTLVRAWDLAASTKGDYTAGVLLGKDAEGRFYVCDVVRGRWSTDERNRRIRSTAEADGKGVKVRFAQDPGQAGVDQVLALTRMLAGWTVTSERVSGDKETRADPFSAQVNVENVWIVDDAAQVEKWNQAFLSELRTFPLGTNDDQVDAASDAFTELMGGKVRTPLFGAGKERPA